jgi:hypothetical protein
LVFEVNVMVGILDTRAGLGLGHLTNAAAGAWVAWLVGVTVVFMEILGAGMAAGDMGN